MRKEIKIAPSLLSADFANLENDTKLCEKGGADILHVDVMDGRFVPNITVGFPVVKALRRITEMDIACHLMIKDPDNYVERFAEAGANMISVHAEGQIHLHRTLDLIAKSGAKAGVALNPATPLDYAFAAAEYCDFILLMSVDPGFGGQKFLDSFLKRSELLKDFLINIGMESTEIEVDGGVKIDNVDKIVKAGANILVCGSGLFKGDLVENIKILRKNAEQALA